MSNKQIPVALLVLFAAACSGARQYELRGTPLAPASDAKVVANIDQNRNVTKLDIESKNMSPPDRIMPGATTYLVWVRKNDEVPWQRLGALDLDDDGRTGNAQLTVSESSFDMVVSAEKSSAVQAPSGKSIFEQRIQKE